MIEPRSKGRPAVRSLSISSHRVLLAAIVLLALGLRVVGLQYGLPAVYNPDEVAIMARALTFAKGTLNPRNFLYPTFYLLRAVRMGRQLPRLRLADRAASSSVAALQQLYFTDPTGIYTAGRLLGAVCGTLGSARRLPSRRSGCSIGGSAWRRRCSWRSRRSPSATPTTSSTTCPRRWPSSSRCIAIIRIWPRRSGSRTARAMTSSSPRRACGVAFSTHYYCIFLALPLTWAIVQRWRGDGWRVVAPARRDRRASSRQSCSSRCRRSCSSSRSTAWRDITANRQIVVDRAVEGGAFGPVGRYARDALDRFDGARRGRARRRRGGVHGGRRSGAGGAAARCFRSAFFAFITNTAPASRYLNPVLPFLAILPRRG